MPLLHHAILARDHRTFEILFKYTKDINLQDQSSGTPLILAVKVQDLDIVRQLLTHPDIDTEKKPLHFRPYTALVEAWWLNNEAIYSELAAAGANVRASGHYDNYLPGYGILDYDQCKKLQETVKIRECCIAFNNILEYPADKLKLGFENRIWRIDLKFIAETFDTNEFVARAVCGQLNLKCLELAKNKSITDVCNIIREFFEKAKQFEFDLQYDDFFPSFHEYLTGDPFPTPVVKALAAEDLTASEVMNLPPELKEYHDNLKDIISPHSALENDADFPLVGESL